MDPGLEKREAYGSSLNLMKRFVLVAFTFVSVSDGEQACWFLERSVSPAISVATAIDDDLLPFEKLVRFGINKVFFFYFTQIRVFNYSFW